MSKSKEQILREHTYSNILPLSEEIQAAMEAYHQQFATQQCGGHWVKASELPEVGIRVIGYFPEGTEGSGGKPVVATAINYSGKVQSDFPNSTAYCFTASHWMPFPQPPGDESISCPCNKYREALTRMIKEFDNPDNHAHQRIAIEEAKQLLNNSPKVTD